MRDVAEKALERLVATGPDDAVVLATEGRDRQVRFSGNDVDVVKTWIDESLHLFAAYDRRVVTTTVPGLDRLDDALKRLEATAKATDPSPDHHGIAEGPFDYQLRRPDPAIRDLDRPGDLVHAGIDAALEGGADTAAGVLYVHDGRTALATTGGCLVEEPWRGLEFSLRAFRGEASGHAVSLSTTLADLDPAGAGARAARFAELGQDPSAGTEGRHRVLFEPLVFAALLDAYGGMLGAYGVKAGLSCFAADDVGSQVASPAVTLLDDPARRDGLFHRAFDDEGRPTRPVAMIAEGELSTFLHNTSTAEAFGAEPTASAGLIAPGPSTLVLEEGSAGMDRDAMLAELGDGLWVTNTWYTRFQNRTTGDFSTLPRDAVLVVEDGEVQGAVTGLRLSDNLRGLFERVEAVGATTEQVKWWAEATTPTFSPPVLVDDVAFTTSRT